MEHWTGPALGAAVVTAIFTVIGWFVNQRNDRRREEAQRIERLIDLQTALRAEIRSYLHNVSATQVEASAQSTIAKIIADPDEAYVPFIPKTPPNVVFEAVVDEIHVLSTPVIDPLTLFYRQIAVISAFVEDMRSESFVKLPAKRRASLFRRYADVTIYSAALAESALTELTRAIRRARKMPVRRISVQRRLRWRKIKATGHALGSPPARLRTFARQSRGQ